MTMKCIICDEELEVDDPIYKTCVQCEFKLEICDLVTCNRERYNTHVMCSICYKLNNKIISHFRSYFHNVSTKDLNKVALAALLINLTRLNCKK